jgi:HlyD family secretion protein
MKRWLMWLLLLGIVAGLGAGGAYAWRGLQLPPQARFKTVPVSRGEVTLVVRSSGNVQPVQSVQVGSFVSGPIQEVFVDHNSRVKLGQPMAQIDPRTYQANMEREEATLEHRRSDVLRVQTLLSLAEHNAERAKKLRDTNRTFLSEAEFEQLVTERESLKAQLALSNAAVREADAALTAARTNLEFTTIKAPVDGIVIEKKVDPGQTVASAFQTPVLFIVAPDLEQKIYVLAAVDEADIGLVREAERRQQPATFSVDAYPDDVFEGQITQVRMYPTTVQNVVTYTAVVQSPNPEIKLLPGMTANLSFQVEQHEDVLRLPNAALRFHPLPDQVRPQDRKIVEGLPDDTKQANGSRSSAVADDEDQDRSKTRRYVWVIDGSVLAAVEVHIGLSDNKYTEIVSGELHEGQELVTGLRSPTDSPAPSP